MEVKLIFETRILYREYHGMQIVVPVVFGARNYISNSNISQVRFCKPSFKRKLGCKFAKVDNFVAISAYIYTYTLNIYIYV